jgi:WD40 repeat protein
MATVNLMDLEEFRRHEGRGRVKRMAMVAPDCWRLCVIFGSYQDLPTIIDWPSGRVWPVESDREYDMTRDGQHVVHSWAGDRISLITEVETGKVIFRTYTDDFDWFEDSWFARGYVYYTHTVESICVFRVTGDERTAEIIVGNHGMVRTSAYTADISADGTLIATVFPMYTIRVWNIESCQLLYSHSPESLFVQGCEFFDQRTIFAWISDGGNNWQLFRWNLQTGKKDKCDIPPNTPHVRLGQYTACIRRGRYSTNYDIYDISRPDKICRIGQVVASLVVCDAWRCTMLSKGTFSTIGLDSERKSMLAFLCARNRLKKRGWKFLPSELAEMIFYFI